MAHEKAPVQSIWKESATVKASEPAKRDDDPALARDLPLVRGPRKRTGSWTGGSASREVTVGGCVFMTLVLVLAVFASHPVAASAVSRQTVDFGLPRTQVVTGLDLEAACQAIVTYQGVNVLDGQSADTFLSTDPGPCAITVYVLGVALSLPILDEPPLGRYHFDIAGVTIANFGIADVSVDLLTSLSASYMGGSQVISPDPLGLSWSQWGTSTVTVAANSGASGDSLSLFAPYTFSMTFGVGASVQALGLTVWSANLATLGAVAGSPAIPIPVSVDLRPSSVSVTGHWAPSPYSIQVNWTLNTDTDFAAYRIAVQSNDSGPLVYEEYSQAAASSTLPAEPGRNYTITVAAVDRAGLVSAPFVVVIHTPVPAAPNTAGGVASSGAPDLSLLLVLFVAILVGSNAVSYRLGRHRRRQD